MEKTGDGTSLSQSTQHKALSKSPPPSNNTPQPGLASRAGSIASGSVNMPQDMDESTYPGSHLAVNPRVLQKVPSYADFTRMALSRNDSQGVTGANPAATSNQPPGSRDARLAGNLTTAGPLAGSTSRPRPTKSKHTSELETAPKPHSQGSQPLSADDARGVAVQPISSSKSSGMSTSKEGRTPPRNVTSSRVPQESRSGTPFGLPRAEEPVEGNQSPLLKADLSREGNTIKPHAQEVDRIASVHPPLKPSIHSTPTPSQPSAPVSSSQSSSAAPITKTGSGRMRTPHRDTPLPPDEDKGQAYRNESSHMRSPSASSRDPRFPPGHVASAVDVDSLSLPQSLDRSSPRIQGNGGIEREAKRAAETLTSDKGGKRTTAPKEPDIQREDPTSDPHSAQRGKPESSPPNSRTPDIERHPKAPPQSSVEPISSSSVSRGGDLGATHLPNSSEFGGNTGRSDAVSSLRRTEASATPHVSLFSQNQAKHAIGTPSNNKPTSSSTKYPPRPPTVVGDSQIRASPFLSRTTSSLVSAPNTPITSREDEMERETRPGSFPSPKHMQSVKQPDPAAGHVASRNAPPTKALPETGDDTSSRLPDYHHLMETHKPSLVQVGSPQKDVENKPHAKPSDCAQPSAHAAPSIIKVSSNIGKERGSQAQLGHSISQAQHSWSESSGTVPNQQHRTDPLITRETGLPSSEHATGLGAPSFPHFRAVVAYVPVPPDEISNPERSPPPPPYVSPGVPVAQEGVPSRSGARMPTDVHDEPKKLPVLDAPHHLDDQGHMDRSGDLKRLLLPTRGDAVAAVCPPPDHSQSVEVYRCDRSHLPHGRHGVRQLEALSSPKIWDRSRSGSSVEQDNETAPQKPRDPPIIIVQQEVGSRGTGSFDEEGRRRRPLAKSDEDGRPGQKDDDERGSQVSHKQRVPKVVLIPPTPHGSVRETLIDIPPVPTPPVPIPPTSTSPPGPPAQSASSLPTESSPRRKKKGILDIICPCLRRADR